MSAPPSQKLRTLFNSKGYPLNINTSSGDNFATPWLLFDLLDKEFHFTIDVCASGHNHKVARYWSIATNALLQIWRGVCWCNPPYSEITPWIKKCREAASNGAVVVALVPARTSEKWFHDCCFDAEIRLLRGRIKFNGAPGKPVYHATFATMLVIFRKKSARIKMPDGSTRLNIREVEYPLQDPTPPKAGDATKSKSKTRPKRTKTNRGNAIAADLAGQNERLKAELRRERDRNFALESKLQATPDIKPELAPPSLIDTEAMRKWLAHEK
jgi:phage N-6-adenine-methyltransferase